MIAINEVTKIIQPPLKSILFADDLSIHLRSSNPQRAHRILQVSINRILKWLSQHGFRISPSKTNLLIFQKRTPSLPFPLFFLNHNTIPQVDSTRVLGLHFQSRHSWLPHIKIIRAKSLRALNILKYLSHPCLLYTSPSPRDRTRYRMPSSA